MSPAAFLSHGTGVRIPVPVPVSFFLLLGTEIRLLTSRGIRTFLVSAAHLRFRQVVARNRESRVRIPVGGQELAPKLVGRLDSNQRPPARQAGPDGRTGEAARCLEGEFGEAHRTTSKHVLAQQCDQPNRRNQRHECFCQLDVQHHRPELVLDIVNRDFARGSRRDPRGDSSQLGRWLCVRRGIAQRRARR